VETINVAWDLWGLRTGYVSEDFVRGWIRRAPGDDRPPVDRLRACCRAAAHDLE